MGMWVASILMYVHQTHHILTKLHVLDRNGKYKLVCQLEKQPGENYLAAYNLKN